MRILGIDPGSQRLGWGFIELSKDHGATRVRHGYFEAKKGPFNQRLGELADKVAQLCKETQPDVAVVEKIFLGKNADSAFKLGHIRGFCIVECHRQGAEIVEYTPREVKKVITGAGGADKITLRRLLYAQLGIVDDGSHTLDASDALAMAYCYCLRWQTEGKLARARRGLRI